MPKKKAISSKEIQDFLDRTARILGHGREVRPSIRKFKFAMSPEAEEDLRALHGIPKRRRKKR